MFDNNDNSTESVTTNTYKHKIYTTELLLLLLANGKELEQIFGGGIMRHNSVNDKLCKCIGGEVCCYAARCNATTDTKQSIRGETVK
uniref:Uncharacterized protein n=1 Tax=Glossina palpalis gambiensis TaxID=67801 RepID=A0A1B0BJZ0_9MUSC